MKIFKTKKMILAVVTALVLISSLPFFQSCSNENTDIPQTSLNNNKTKEITLSEIPTGITPIFVKNKDELNNLINKLDNAKVVRICSIGERSSNKQIRFKSHNEISLDYLSFSVYVDAVYLKYGDTVRFRVYFVGLHPGVEISGVTSTYHWHSYNYLDYEVNYTLDAYINFEGKWIFYSFPHVVKEDNVYVPSSF